MKLAAVDIGSNAIRLQVTNVTYFEGKTNFKKLEYLRFPLRLGLDVFHSQKISEKNRMKFIKLMKAFKLLIDLYEVDDYMVCATSAMRESVNGREIFEEVQTDIGMKINIIDGNHEAELINLALGGYIDEKSYLHNDVGGRNTELNIYINKEKIATRSFKIGSVRALDEIIPVSVWKSMNKFITDHLTNQDNIIGIGTGGNISKILELSNPGKGVRVLEIEKITEVQAYLESISYEDRINRLNLNPDRADVIIPASKIYLSAMSAASSKKMIVPDVGLKDGMMQVLYRKNKNKKAVI